MVKMKTIILPLLLFLGSVFSEVLAVRGCALPARRAKAVAEAVGTHIHFGIIDKYKSKYSFAFSAAEAVKPAIAQALQCDDMLLQFNLIENGVARALSAFVHRRYVETRTPARPDFKVPALKVIENGLNWYNLSQEIERETALYPTALYPMEAGRIALAVKRGVTLARASVENEFAIPEAVMEYSAREVSDPMAGVLVNGPKKGSVMTCFCYVAAVVVAGISAGVAILSVN